MFQDEGRFGRLQDSRRCWAPKGIRPEIMTQIVREYTYVFAADSPEDGILDTLILPEVNTEAMSLFLNEIAQGHSGEFILMFLDGAGWHKSKSMVIPKNIRLLPLPPYSPQLNPAEHIWDEIREKLFPNKIFSSLTAIEDNLEQALV
jgi:transposase